MLLNVLNNTNYLKSNDTGSKIRLLVSDYAGKEIDLKQFEKVEVVIGNETGKIRTITPQLEENIGELSFSFTLDTLVPNGRYKLEVLLHNENGTIRVAPSRKYLYLYIEKSLDEIEGEEVNVIHLKDYELRVDEVITQALETIENTRSIGESADKEEVIRQQNEQQRQQNEAQRQSNENTRQQNEIQRQNTLGEMNELIENTRYVGEWSPSTVYKKNNIVLYINQTFISLTDNNVGNTPNPNENTEHWGIVAKTGGLEREDLQNHETDNEPHRYGNKFAWRYNSTDDVLELVVYD